MPLLTLLLVLSDLLELTFTVTKHTTVFIIALTQHVMHFVRCSDLDTKTLQWVESSTSTIMDTVQIARHGRAAMGTPKLPGIVYKQSLNTSTM